MVGIDLEIKYFLSKRLDFEEYCAILEFQWYQSIGTLGVGNTISRTSKLDLHSEIRKV